MPRLGILAATLAAAVLLPARLRADELTTAERAEVHELERRIVRTVELVRGATVSVLAKTPATAAGGPGGRPLPLQAVGSGVLVRYRGLFVLTNLHVVDSDATFEVVTADGRHFPVQVRARDRQGDLALLSFRTAPDSLRSVPLEGRRTPRPDDGSWVLATGNPFFLALDGRAVATLGVVSGLRPPDETTYVDAPTLQHDAEINPGSSGGPLWSARGELLGLNGTIATRSRAQGAGPAYTGASFAVPMERIQRFLASVTEPSRPVEPRPDVVASLPPPVVRPTSLLGIRYTTETDGRGEPLGARVTSVLGPSPGRPSSGDGALLPGDVITGFATGGRAWRIRSAQDVHSVLRGLVPGTTVTLRFVRSGQTLRWTGRLGVR